MLKRIVHYITWLKREYKGKDKTSAIYDSLSKDNNYEYIVDYTTRVNNLKDALSSVDIKYKGILDIACGTGAFIDALPDKKSLKILGIDISEEMLKLAKKRFKDYPNISFKLADFMKTDFKPQSFDLITMAYATRFIPKGKEQEFAKNISKWLTKDGGFLVILPDISYAKTIKTLSYLIYSPKGFNIDMDFEDYLVKQMNPYLFLSKKLKLKNQFIIFGHKALYFKKK